jgi:hypothetical protein
MTKARLFAAGLAAVVASVTVGVPVALAGGGMGAGSGVTTCRLIINGAANQPQTVGVVDSFTPTTDLMKVGIATLVCDIPAVGSTVSGPATGTPVGVTANSVTCYSVASADSGKVPVTLRDPFTEATPAQTQQVTLGAIQFLCVPSVMQ